MSDRDPKIKQVARKILVGGRNVVFTGTGISTESDISDYRSKGGFGINSDRFIWTGHAGGSGATGNSLFTKL